jgi:hypothetical protein
MSAMPGTLAFAMQNAGASAQQPQAAFNMFAQRQTNALPQNAGINDVLGFLANQPYTPVQAPDLGINDPRIKNLINYQQYLFNLANQQNQQRFQLAAQALRGQGQSSITDVNEASRRVGAEQTQQMMDRGLTNSTVPLAMNQGLERERQRQVQRIQEGVADRVVGLLGSKTDQAPASLNFADLMRQAVQQPAPVNTSALGGGMSVSYTGQDMNPFARNFLNLPRINI